MKVNTSPISLTRASRAATSADKHSLDLKVNSPKIIPSSGVISVPQSKTVIAVLPVGANSLDPQNGHLFSLTAFSSQ
jgi:hypothetical protein